MESRTFAHANKERRTRQALAGKRYTHRGVEQLVARQAHNLEVVRSSRASATTTMKEGKEGCGLAVVSLFSCVRQSTLRREAPYLYAMPARGGAPGVGQRTQLCSHKALKARPQRRAAQCLHAPPGPPVTGPTATGAKSGCKQNASKTDILIFGAILAHLHSAEKCIIFVLQDRDMPRGMSLYFCLY